MSKFLKILIFVFLALFAGFWLAIFTLAQNNEIQGAVYVCPLAIKMEEINPRCKCRIDLVLGETATSTCNGKNYAMTLTTTNYEGKDYYFVLGFENGGAGVNSKPEAKIAAPFEAYINQEVLFDGFQSSDQNQDSLDFFRDFGNGNYGQGQKISHAYQSSGDYLVSLTVFDGMASSTATATIKILSLPLLGGQPRFSVKKEAEETLSLLKKEIEKPETLKEFSFLPKIVKTSIISRPQSPKESLSLPQISETSTSSPTEIFLEKPKSAGLQEIQPKEPPFLLAALAQVLKEKPYFLFGVFISVFLLLIFLFLKFWGIKNFLFFKKY